MRRELCCVFFVFVEVLSGNDVAVGLAWWFGCFL